MSESKVKEMERHLVILMSPIVGQIGLQLTEGDREMIAEQITLLIRAVVSDEMSKRGEE